MINIREFLGLGYYISELDTFLMGFDKNHPSMSVSQSNEIGKYSRIFAMRDIPADKKDLTHEPKEDVWDKF